jgi:hypothetical protein
MSGNLLGSHENLLKTLNERRMELIQYLKGVIREASERGQVRKDIETEEMVYGYLGMLESAIEQMHLRWESNPEDEHPIDIKTKVETIMLILLDGIRGEGNE